MQLHEKLSTSSPIYIILTISTVIFSCHFYKSYKKQTNKIYDNKVAIQSKLLELNKIKNIYINIQNKEKITNKNKKAEKLITSLQTLQTEQINLFENIINKITKDLKNNIKIPKWKSETNTLTITGIATNYKYLASLSYILKKNFSYTKIIKISESENKYLINFKILATN